MMYLLDEDQDWKKLACLIGIVLCIILFVVRIPFTIKNTNSFHYKKHNLCWKGTISIYHVRTEFKEI